MRGLLTVGAVVAFVVLLSNHSSRGMLILFVSASAPFKILCFSKARDKKYWTYF